MQVLGFKDKKWGIGGVIILKWELKKLIGEKSAKIWVNIYLFSKNKLLLTDLFPNVPASWTKVTNRGCVIHSTVALMR
jgi:hypothetical protein